MSCLHSVYVLRNVECNISTGALSLISFLFTLAALKCSVHPLQDVS